MSPKKKFPIFPSRRFWMLNGLAILFLLASACGSPVAPPANPAEPAGPPSAPAVGTVSPEGDQAYKVNAALSSAMGWTFVSDVVCSLAKPFSIIVKQSSGYDMTFNFTPASSPQAGSINITATRDTGTGTYTVESADTEAPVIKMHYTMVTPQGATVEWNGIPFVLGPLDTNQCRQ